jgi:predicted transcriptional regulator
MAKDFTKILSSIMLDTKDLMDWGISGGHTTPGKLRLTIAARTEVAQRLIGSGVSKRKAAKLLGVSHQTIQRDMAQKVPKTGTKGATKKQINAKPEIKTLDDWCDLFSLEIHRAAHTLEKAQRDELYEHLEQAMKELQS